VPSSKESTGNEPLDEDGRGKSAADSAYLALATAAFGGDGAIYGRGVTSKAGCAAWTSGANADALEWLTSAAEAVFDGNWVAVGDGEIEVGNGPRGD